MAEVAIPRNLFAEILRLIAELRPPPAAVVKRLLVLRPIKNQRGEVRLDDNKIHIFGARRANVTGLGARKPRAEELASGVWVSLRIARPTQTGQIERVLLSNLRASGECRFNDALKSNPAPTPG
jgi:hypothetical protein